METSPSNLVSIRLDPAEILDRVDDMLAWEAIASTSCRGYLHRHLLKAEPYILLGGNTVGYLTPSTIEAYDDGYEVLSQDERRDQILGDFQKAERMLPDILANPMLRGFAHAKIEECEVTDQICPDTTIWEGDKVGEHDDDLISNVRYRLHSVGELNRQEAAPYIRAWRFPQTARVFQAQEIVALRDGRAANGYRVCGYWNGRLFDSNRMPLGAYQERAEGVRWDLMPSLILNGIGHYGLSRANWHVELSFTKNRTGVALQTDAIGAREIAKMIRGESTNAGRRKAMVHWVSEHMRRRRAIDREAEIAVRAHLRGQKELSAGRYYLRIWPSVDALHAASNGAKYDHQQIASQKSLGV